MKDSLPHLFLLHRKYLWQIIIDLSYIYSTTYDKHHLWHIKWKPKIKRKWHTVGKKKTKQTKPPPPPPRPPHPIQRHKAKGFISFQWTTHALIQHFQYLLYYFHSRSVHTNWGLFTRLWWIQYVNGWRTTQTNYRFL
jgi:hypothetical protein